MPDYKDMYLKLFNKVTEAIMVLEEAQNDCEDAFIESNKTHIIALKREDDQ